MRVKPKLAGTRIPAKAENGTPLGFHIWVGDVCLEGVPPPDVARTVGDATLGWEPRIVLDGKVLPFSTQNAADLYRRRPFILRQVIAAITKEH